MLGVSRRIAVPLAVLLLAGAAATPALAAPRSAQAPPLQLTALCTDPVTNTAIMRIRNDANRVGLYTWADRSTPQSGSGAILAQKDLFFRVADGSRAHTIDLYSGTRRVATRGTTTTRCEAQVAISKAITGTAPAGARFPVRVSGTSGVVQTFDLAEGEARTVVLPGTIAAGEAEIGELNAGYLYVVSELDLLDAGAATATPETLNVTGPATSSVVLADNFTGPPARPSADLLVTSTVSQAGAQTGSPSTFTLTVTNRGPDVATNVAIASLVSTLAGRSTVTVETVTSPDGACTTGVDARCTLGTLDVGSSATVTVGARLDVLGVLSGVATATASEPDPNPTNNRQAEGVVYGSSGPGAELSLRKTASKRRVRAGKTVTFRLRAQSTGSVSASQVRICDRLPSAFTVVRAIGARISGGRICWGQSELVPGARRTVELVARALNPRTRARTTTNTGTVRAADTASASASATVTVLRRGSRGGGVTG